MKPVQVSENIYWVGAVDWNIRDFHGYLTESGSTYNAYLILDEKVTLIDTVKKEFTGQLMESIRQLVDPRKIEIVISNHTEMDHSGGLPHVMHAIGAEKPVFCSKMGQKNLSGHFGPLNYQPVDNGGTLEIGARTLHFLETRMLHWPDSMFTYSPSDKLLFSSDAFGQHYAGLERFDSEVGDGIWPHALKYYANILMPYSPLITKLLAKVGELGLEIETICPDHGIIWREDPGAIISAYAQWARQEPSPKAVVIYDTMWHSTAKMAEAIVEGVGLAGVDAFPLHLRANHRSDVITELFDAGAVVVGSPTLNNGLYPTVADFLCYAKGLKPKNKIGAAFGSYGWSGEAAKLIHVELADMGFSMIEPEGLRQLWVPDDEGLGQAMALGKRIGQALAQLDD